MIRPEHDVPETKQTHLILLGTFRHPVIYILSFDPQTRCLEKVGEARATGGHSWLNLSPDGSVVYATVWNQDTPRLAAYQLCRSTLPPDETFAQRLPKDKVEALSLNLINECDLDHLSGCLCSNRTTLFSASGPQCDVVHIDPATGGFANRRATQSLAFVAPHAEDGQVRQPIIGADKKQSFGGLRHGGHSAELSPDGTKFYVADIGRNCIWIYRVSDSEPCHLTLLSQYHSRRPNDGPRHTWPHPNGRIVYCVQEHSSYVDVLEHVGDDLVWRQGARILPEHKQCSDFWADEVRTDARGKVLFGSTRGLTPTEKGYVCAWPLLENGWIDTHAVEGDRANSLDHHHELTLDDIPARHTFQTPTSGGWANAIAVCPQLGPRGETWLTLTDSEEGHSWILSWSEEDGFEIVQDFRLPKDEQGGTIGASVGMWVA